MAYTNNVEVIASQQAMIGTLGTSEKNVRSADRAWLRSTLGREGVGVKFLGNSWPYWAPWPPNTLCYKVFI